MNSRIVTGIIMIAIGMIMFPLVLTGAHDINTDPQTDQYIDLNDSGTPNYSADVLLTKDVYLDDVGNVTSVTSNSGTDVPVASSLTTGGTLTVTGLLCCGTGPGTRTLSVTYDYGAAEGYTGLQSLVLIAPLILFTSLVFGGGVTAYSGYKQTAGKGKKKKK